MTPTHETIIAIAEATTDEAERAALRGLIAYGHHVNNPAWCKHCVRTDENGTPYMDWWAVLDWNTRFETYARAGRLAAFCASVAGVGSVQVNTIISGMDSTNRSILAAVMGSLA